MVGQSYEEHNKKNEVDQESVTENEVQKLKHSEDNRKNDIRARVIERIERNKQRIEIINALIMSQFQPLIFSVESNPLLGTVMRPYIDSLREQTRTVAFFFSEMAGHQEGLTDSYWLAAQKYVDSLGVWATALSASAETSFNESFRMLWEAVPPQKYFQIVWGLAHEMWMNTGRPYFHALDFWVSAENHILTIGGRSIANAKTLFEAVGSLGRTFSDFAADAYLAGIRKRAYYIWKSLEEPCDHAFDDWLQAEAQTLALEK